MAELLLRVVSKTNPDNPYLDAALTKRGDVIVVQPDGWAWGREELSAPFWRILRVPGMTVSEASVLLAPERSESREQSRVLQRRAFRVDLDAFDVSLASAIDAPRDSHVDVAAELVRAATARKPALQDPAAIGYGADVIG